MKKLEFQNEFKKAYDLYSKVNDTGLSFFDQNSAYKNTWFKHNASCLKYNKIPQRLSNKEVIIFSSQRSGSTLFSQLLMKDFSCGNPREHFNHAFRGDYNNGSDNASFSDIWNLGRRDDIVSHKIMASDFSRFASVIGSSGSILEKLEDITRFFTTNPSHFFYRVKRNNFFEQYQSSMTAQLTGVYFGKEAPKNSLDINHNNYHRFVNTWLSLKLSEIVLDKLWEQLGNNKRLVTYEDNLRKEAERIELSKLIENDLKIPCKKETSVNLTPPTTVKEKEKNKKELIDFLNSKIGHQAFELYFK